MMRLIDDQHVPAGGGRLLTPLRMPGQQFDTAQHQLLLEEDILVWLAGSEGFNVPGIINAEEQVEPAQQLDEPLVHQGFGHTDQDPFNPPNR